MVNNLKKKGVHSSDSDDDVILVHADEPTSSQAERAAKLQFARTFCIKIDQVESPRRKLITLSVIKCFRWYFHSCN